jgi:hypothetical protein
MNCQKLICLTLIQIAVTFVSTAKCHAQVVYQNGFEGSVGSEWSSSATSQTPAGARRFLGKFANDTVSLSLLDLPAHTEATLSFDLFIIDTWDGNNTDFGPDRWQVTQDGVNLLDTTFSQHIDEYLQSYPDPYLSNHRRRTGAAEVDTLGYTEFGDSVYSLSFSFPHLDDSLEFSFSAIGLEDVDSESWGLDNVVVSIKPVPEPGSITLLLCGTIALFTCAPLRRRR